MGSRRRSGSGCKDHERAGTFSCWTARPMDISRAGFCPEPWHPFLQVVPMEKGKKKIKIKPIALRFHRTHREASETRGLGVPAPRPLGPPRASGGPFITGASETSPRPCGGNSTRLRESRPGTRHSAPEGAPKIHARSRIWGPCCMFAAQPDRPGRP